jgi:hypothetical protein
MCPFSSTGPWVETDDHIWLREGLARRVMINSI